jgi:quercetin dioxygenase-like cupin family protein
VLYAGGGAVLSKRAKSSYIRGSYEPLSVCNYNGTNQMQRKHGVFCTLLLSPLISGHPVPKVIVLDPQGKDCLRLLGGPPETSTMHFGLVTLHPTKNVGKHTTEDYEELVIVLAGRGEMRITEGEMLVCTKGEVAYCPAHAEHDVYNIGPKELRSIYVVAKTVLLKGEK